MDLLTDSSAVATAPALPSPLTGTRGYFTGGIPGVQAATRVRYWWLNLVAEELMSFLTAAGITPDPTNSGQVLAAVRELIAARMGNVLAFQTPGVTDWTVPPNVTAVAAQVWAAGGAGGDSSSTSFPGGGGGGGGFTAGVFTVTPGTVIPVTVGAGGAAFGAAGGASAFGAFCSATGGGGGAAGTGSAIGVGGAGGTGTGGALIVPGANGSNGIQYGSSGAVEGGDGGGAFSAPASYRAIGSSTAALAANAGLFPGGGATGATTGAVAAGAGGLVLLSW